MAKAQAVLVNPEKSLVGTIPAECPGGSERSFRYASLASGLEIVRKTLGEHEIATVQATAIDQDSGIVNLTTVLAHSSGEWIASEWPVCPIAETAAPHRMGAALTYARRYALFTLVGIAGEDDLDAPDLLAPSGRVSVPERADPAGNGKLNGNRGGLAPSGRHHCGKPEGTFRPALGAQASAELRDRLLAEIAEIGSPDDAALWAYCQMRAKNGLTPLDARRVEEAFQTRLAGLTGHQEGVSPEGADLLSDTASRSHEPVEGPDEITAPNVCPATFPQPSADPRPHGRPDHRRKRRASKQPSASAEPVGAIDKAVLTFPEPRCGFRSETARDSGMMPPTIPR
ncbi:MAG TPA: ERF family protein [Pirellulales bacterium]|nr:ERF family protein [Pirellulales bacterium]